MATCNAGETLIAGGGGVTSPPAVGIAMPASRPELAPGTATPARWQVIMENQSGATATFQAFAICAS